MPLLNTAKRRTLKPNASFVIQTAVMTGRLRFGAATHTLSLLTAAAYIFIGSKQ